MSQASLSEKLNTVRDTLTLRRMGHVVQVVGLIVEGEGPPAALGETCTIQLADGGTRTAEVVGFRGSRILLMPLDELEGIRPGMAITALGRPLSVPAGHGFIGRVVDGLGRPIDGKGPIRCESLRPMMAPPPDPMRRARVSEPMPLGVRSVDAFMTCGRGQRVGFFGGSGVGKSTLLGMFARYAQSDVNVIALIGERGREVRDFIEKDLGTEGLKRSVVVVVTSDQPALLRVKGAMAASAFAEYFRDQGSNVLLMMDSVTRVCMAQREIGLAVGEPPTTRGYTPSVFSMLPRLLERSGMAERGSITGLYTVLVEGDDMNEPVADAVRSILDGHVVISRDLAAANHFPAIDVLHSASRVMSDVTTPQHRHSAGRLRGAMATYVKSRDLIDVGAYIAGSNAEIDTALKVWPKLQEFLRQGAEEKSDFAGDLGRLQSIASMM